MTEQLRIGLSWQLTTYTGWGVVGMNIALALSAMPDVELYVGGNTDRRGVNPLDALKLSKAIRPWTALDVLISADGNHCGGPPSMAAKHLGLMVFEDTAILRDEQKLNNLRKYDWLVTASRWNHELLESAGLPNVLVQQGIDPTVWHPAPKSGRWRDRFIVFSGGKLEYRKGQDIVLAAFRTFQQSHPEALLVTAWQSPWPGFAIDMTLNGHVAVEPETLGNQLDIEGWCEDNGLPDGSYLDVGIVPNVMLAPIVREADVAVFASRAEGGTNLMAMECMAAGIGTITSGNTGHNDVGDWRLVQRSRPRPPSRFFGVIDGWGETDPDVLAEALEDSYVDKLRGCADYLGPQPPTWQHHADQLVNLIRNHASA